jgi:hypothetical protein
MSCTTGRRGVRSRAMTTPKQQPNPKVEQFSRIFGIVVAIAAFTALVLLLF